jgi:hypothetical protein
MNWFVPGCFSQPYRTQALCLCGAARAEPGAANWGCRSSLGKNFRAVGRKWPQLRNPHSALSRVRDTHVCLTHVCLTCVTPAFVQSILDAGGDVKKLLALQVQVRRPACRRAFLLFVPTPDPTHTV